MFLALFVIFPFPIHKIFLCLAFERAVLSRTLFLSLSMVNKPHIIGCALLKLNFRSVLFYLFLQLFACLKHPILTLSNIFLVFRGREFFYFVRVRYYTRLRVLKHPGVHKDLGLLNFLLFRGSLKSMQFFYS